MKRTPLSLLAALFFTASPALLWAENDGLDQLNEATRLGLKIQSPRDVERVVELCELALEKGLDEVNQEFAKQLIVSNLWQHGSRYASQIFDQPRPHPQWRRIRGIAIQDLEKLVRYDDQFADAYLLLARLYSLPKEQPDKAMDAVDKAIDLFQDKSKKSDAYLRRAELQKDEEARLADLNHAVKVDATNSKAWQTRASYFLAKGKVEDAIRDFEKLLESDSDNVAVHQAIAEALNDLERYELALEHIGKAIELAPNQSLNYTLRSRIYQNMEQPEKAIAELSKALELQPDDVFALLSRAQLNYLVDDLPNARSDIERVLELRPRSAEATLVRSMIAAAEQRYGDAIDDLQKILQVKPDDVDLQLQLASFYIADERPTKAIELLSLIIESDKQNWVALRTRADTLLSVGKHKEAIEDYNVALEIKPDNDGILNNLAWVLATSPRDHLRDGERAIELATRACEVTKFEKPHILSTLAAAYAEHGDFEAAIKWSTKAVEKGKTDLEDQLEQLQQELESYKNGKPWRELQEIKDKPDSPRRVIEA